MFGCLPVAEKYHSKVDVHIFRRRISRLGCFPAPSTVIYKQFSVAGVVCHLARVGREFGVFRKGMEEWSLSNEGVLPIYLESRKCLGG